MLAANTIIKGNVGNYSYTLKSTKGIYNIYTVSDGHVIKDIKVYLTEINQFIKNPSKFFNNKSRVVNKLP